jgi:hypothetical protein
VAQCAVLFWERVLRVDTSTAEQYSPDQIKLHEGASTFLTFKPVLHYVRAQPACLSHTGGVSVRMMRSGWAHAGVGIHGVVGVR